MKLLRTERNILISLLEEQMDRHDKELSRIEDMVKDASYLYMTSEIAWKHKEPIEKKMKALLSLRDKLLDHF